MSKRFVCCALLALVLSAFLVQEAAALGKIKKLAALGILAKALRPHFLPLPLPIPIGHHKEYIPKPVLVPYPVHHFHKQFVSVQHIPHHGKSWGGGGHGGWW